VVVLYVVLLGTLGMGFVAFIALAILVDIVSDISKYLAGRRSRRQPPLK
jgi:Na+-transporting methylmalonyl-CoA/oxaloacetate decarboxylase gamma subunit